MKRTGCLNDFEMFTHYEEDIRRMLLLEPRDRNVTSWGGAIRCYQGWTCVPGWWIPELAEQEPLDGRPGKDFDTTRLQRASS